MSGSWVMGHDADDHAGLKRSERPAVIGTVPMIAQNKEVSFRNGEGAKLIQFIPVVFIADIVFFLFFVIDIQVTVTQFNDVARETDDPLDKGSAAGNGKKDSSNIKAPDFICIAA